MKGWDIAESGFCSMCKWAIDLHPLDAEGVDVGRCPDDVEQARLQRAHDVFRDHIGLMVRSFPRASR